MVRVCLGPSRSGTRVDRESGAEPPQSMEVGKAGQGWATRAMVVRGARCGMATWSHGEGKSQNSRQGAGATRRIWMGEGGNGACCSMLRALRLRSG
jgi:hypothetical protein